MAVVIPNWNTLPHLKRCLASLERAGKDVQLELMVVDNGSADGSVEYLRESGASYVGLPRNVGFAAAVNLGVARTRSPAVLVLNADTEVDPGALARLLARLEADEALGGVQPLILQLEQSAAEGARRVYSAGQSLTRDGRAFEESAGEPQAEEHRSRREPFGVCGAACLLRRELFEQLGGYDETYGSFYEDVDLNVRARIAGWRFEVVPEAVVLHVGNASWQAGFAEPSAENARLVARNRLSTQVKFLPAAALPRLLGVEVGALARSARRGRLRATAQGKLEALRRLRPLLGERRRLAAEGEPQRAREWLGRRPRPLP